MKCPICQSVFKSPGQAKGGKAARHGISPANQAKMQAARKKAKNERKAQ